MTRYLFTIIVAVPLMLTAAILKAEDSSPRAGEQIKWQTVAAGGTTLGTSSGYRLSCTVGQTVAGFGQSGSYRLSQGFQQNFGPTCKCGDADGNGFFSISDPVRLINYIFAGGAAPNPICRGDANGSGTVNISDAVFIINYIFAGGPAPHCS